MGPVFASPVVVHWSVNKTVTGYYTRVMLGLRKVTGLCFHDLYADANGLAEAFSQSDRVTSSLILLSDLLDQKVRQPTDRSWNDHVPRPACSDGLGKLLPIESN